MSKPFLLLPFGGIVPVIEGPLAYAGARSATLGRVRLGCDAHLGEDCVIRADGNDVTIGRDAFLGARTTVHIAHGTLATSVGTSLTTGSNVVIHACTIGDRCVIEDNAVVLDGAVVLSDVLIAAGTTVLPRKRLEGGWVYAGSPARAVRQLNPDELSERAHALRAGTRPGYTAPSDAAIATEATFVATTAQIVGNVTMVGGSSLFFSCVADAGSGSISIGENTNVQDNTILTAGNGATMIARNSTIGHNVRLGACRIGERCLIGIGSSIADGTVVEDDSFVAAGTQTVPGQVIRSGHVWAGRPAAPISVLDDKKKAIIVNIVTKYRNYAREFRALQEFHALQQEVRDIQ